MAIWDTVVLREKRDITKQKWQKLKKERVCEASMNEDEILNNKVTVQDMVDYANYIDTLYQKEDRDEISQYYEM